MTGRERILALIAGQPVDHLPLMPITMMFATHRLGIPYKKYVTDYRTLAEVQLRTAEEFHFDHVSVISDPAREATDLGGVIEWFEDQPPAVNESQAILASKAALVGLQFPDPTASRMGDRVAGVAALAQGAAVQLAVEGWVEGPCAMAADLRGLKP